MRQETVSEFSDFVRHTEIFGLLAHLVVFRGQPVQGNLLPAIARSDRTKNTVSTERDVLEQLQLLGASFTSPAHGNLLELLVLAQHFGLKTRLLDWTRNPLAALWFACSDQVSGDVFVYALEADKSLQKDVYEKDPFEQPETRVFQPRSNNPRIIAQHGWFTLHRYSTADKRFVSLEHNLEAKDKLTEFRILASKRNTILESLDRHGINHQTMYPDLQGVCLHLNWKHALGEQRGPSGGG